MYITEYTEDGNELMLQVYNYSILLEWSVCHSQHIGITVCQYTSKQKTGHMCLS
jgi:hypothetical protein